MALLKGWGLEAAFNQKVEPWMMRVMASPLLGRAVNTAYNRAGPQVQAWFWRALSRSRYPERSAKPLALSSWQIQFGGQWLRMPLEGRTPGLEWDNATAILGHDIDVKRTYLAFIEAGAVDVFIDVGTNFGTHSLLFLAQGLRTISFEPLPECHGYFLDVCSRNGLVPDLRKMALGSSATTLRMRYPVGQTWLARVISDSESQGPANIDDDEHEVTVPVSTLDQTLAAESLPRGRVLVKLDVEGHEVSVLQGARDFLEQTRPWILFESTLHADRAPMVEVLRSAGYAVHALPLRPQHIGPVVDAREFCRRRQTNFMAVPASRPW